ncbi:MAG: zf-HC2 domain-containing protein [Planctomycetes bacterium]|nr:zf-HC2 domain-containing protein [Planctomycetota bacterium]
MATPPSADRGNDPCLQIQVDLSAMLDGELDPASVRRVMVHSDVCAGCRSFLRGIRDQVRMHRSLAALGEGLEPVPAGGGSEEPAERAEQLRRKLTENRRKLSRILYELGRGFVLMGLSPDFSREVAKEPVPVPDMAQRGRNLLDEVSRSPEGGEHDWVLAKELLDGQLRTPDENLAKGQRLLSECLALDERKHEARIYLGLAHYVRGQRSLARKQFTLVLASTQDRQTRAYALLNLGNIHLDEGDNDGAVQLLLQLIESGVVEEQPRLSMSYFNLGLAYGMQGRFSECLHWFRRLHDEMPHKRAAVSRELERRRQFVHLVRNHPEARLVAESFPAWFAAVDC